MAILAAFAATDNSDLGSYLNSEVFSSVKTETSTATKEEIAGYQNFLARYATGLAAVKSAAERVN
jgi:ABC-type proline/glycine betaine transport system substrate-binding protein